MRAHGALIKEPPLKEIEKKTAVGCEQKILSRVRFLNVYQVGYKHTYLNFKAVFVQYRLVYQ